VTGPLRVEVVYAANVQVGDWFAGDVDPDAPTRPAQPAAAALRITSVETVDGVAGKCVQMTSLLGRLGDRRVADQCMVIRGACLRDHQ